MNGVFGGLSRPCAACALAVLVAGLMAAGGQDAAALVAVAADCDDTCQNGATTDPNPCVTSAKGDCKVAAGAPAGTQCLGCNFRTANDKNGNIIGCVHNCASFVTQ